MTVSRCVNCSLLLKHPLPQRQVTEATDAMLSVLNSWISPATVSEDSCLCQECFFILQNASIQSGDLIERTYGHQNVCFPCGKSILRAKTHNVPVGSPEGHIILTCIPIQQVHRLEKVCLSCWTNAYRSVKRHVDQNRHQDVPEVGTSHEDDIIMSSARSSMDPPIPIPPPLPLSEQASYMSASRSSPKICSRIYKRAPATSRHCIFTECHNTERLLVPSVIKEMLLIDHKLYIPNSARICLHHLNVGSWRDLSFSLSYFSGYQMDDMMSIMDRASRRQIDFANIRGMNPHLCYYWLGKTCEQFYQLLSQIPQLSNEVKCPSVALSALLVKLRSGDSNERLSTLFNLPRSTLERYMNKARNCLENSFVEI